MEETPRSNRTPPARSSPAPTVASITTALAAKSFTTSDASAGRWGLSKHPDGQEPQPDVAGHDRGHQSHQVEALPDLGDQRSLHRTLPSLSLRPRLGLDQPCYGSSVPAV